jgi:hypothetical protein
VDTKFFSLDTATGTARAIVYWDRLSEREKADILFTAHHPDPSFLEMILQEGNPLLIEIAFRGLLACNFRRSQFNRYIDLVPRAIDVIENQWNTRLGFTQWSDGGCPVHLASDFYTWVRGEATDETCAEIEAWTNEFCTQSQLQRKVIVERSHIIISVGVPAACLRRGKLSSIEAFELFKVAIARHRDRYYEEDEEWRLTWDDGMVLSSFLSCMAIAENDYFDEEWSLLASCVSALSNFVILEESVEPFLAMHPRSLTLMLLMRKGSNLSVLRRRLIEIALREDENACPPSVRLGILRSDDVWDELLRQCSKRSDALRFALGAFPITQRWANWGFSLPKDSWLCIGMGFLSDKICEEWISSLDHLDDRQRTIELAEMACLCEAMVTSGGQGWDVASYHDCDFTSSSFDYSKDEAVVSGDIVATYENLLRRDPFGRRVGRWRKWRTHMDEKYGLFDRHPSTCTQRENREQ